jgi:hypothetical protein
MKKIFTFIIATCSVVTGFAQWQQGGPNQYPNQNPNYPQQNNNYNQYSSLLISSGLQRQLTVSVDNYQYQAGNHNIVISQWRTNLWGRQIQEVIYNSSLYFKPGYETNIFVDGYGRTNITERQLYANSNNQGGYNNNGNGVGYGYGRAKNKHKKSHCDNDDHDNNQGNRNDRGRNDRRGDDDN